MTARVVEQTQAFLCKTKVSGSLFDAAQRALCRVQLNDNTLFRGLRDPMNPHNCPSKTGLSRKVASKVSCHSLAGRRLRMIG